MIGATRCGSRCERIIRQSPAPVILAMYIAAAKRRFEPGIVPKLRGTVQADILKEVQAQNEILFPVDRMRNVNRGRLELRTFDPEKDLAAAEATAAAAKSGKDPFAGRTGDVKRHYRLDAANEIIPYRLYVPTAYTGAKAYPLTSVCVDDSLICAPAPEVVHCTLAAGIGSPPLPTARIRTSCGRASPGWPRMTLSTRKEETSTSDPDPTGSPRQAALIAPARRSGRIR